MHHTYDPRVAYNFANPERFHLSFSQRFFRFKASNWWNSLPSPLIRENDKNVYAFCKDYSQFIGSCVVFNCRLVSVTIDYILSIYGVKFWNPSQGAISSSYSLQK